jgi:PAS domain S-box-containing protein
MQLSIGSKLALGIGTVMGLFFISGIAVYWQAGHINDLITIMSESDEPTVNATYAMETDLAETGLALKSYLHRPSLDVLERLREEENDFRKSYAAYSEVARSAEAKRLGEQVEQAYSQYMAIATKLIRFHDQQAASLKSYFRLEQSLYDLLEQRIKTLFNLSDPSTSPKLKTILEMKIKIYQLGLDLNNFLRSHDPQHETRTKEDTREFSKFLDDYQALKLTAQEERWVTELRRSFDDTMGLVSQLIGLEKYKQDSLTESVKARLTVNKLLDEKLQQHTQNTLAETRQTLLDIGERSVFLMFMLLFVALLVSVAAGVITNRSISRPLQQLLAAIEAMGQGDLSWRVTLTSNGEVAQLAQAFNRMAEDLQRTTVSRAYVEGIIRSMGESLIVVSSDGVIETANPAACVLLGYRETELVGSPFSRLLAEWPKLVEQIMAGAVHDYEAEYRTKDGRYIPILFSADRMPLSESDGTAVVCVALDITELKRSRHALAESRERLRELARHLNATIEADRSRIAREIHDQLGQAMTGLKLDLGWLGRKLEQGLSGVDSSVRDRIGTMSRLIDDTIRTVRRVATELRPAVLDDLGLGPALETLAEQFTERSGVTCETDFPEQITLASQQATALYRIAQEALTNVSRHANATWVKLQLSAEQNTVILEIADNGGGISTERMTGRRSLGLLGMQERANELGGEVAIDSKRGEGTTVRVKIPLTPAAIKALQ